jgi:hypothetical protein
MMLLRRKEQLNLGTFVGVFVKARRSFPTRLASKRAEAVIMSGMFFLLLALMGPVSLQAAQTPQNAFVGCLNRLPDGTLQFGGVPSGKLFLLGGETNSAEEHLNQLVRVFGELDWPNTSNNVPPTLKVVRVQALAKSCTSTLPTRKMEAVPGKVGEDTVAVPLTTTLSEDRTTPGFQTQAATAGSDGLQNNRQKFESPAAPPRPEQVAQSEAAANLNASAVERTEILPGSTLGAGPSASLAEPGPAAVRTTAASPASTSSVGEVVVDR